MNSAHGSGPPTAASVARVYDVAAAAVPSGATAAADGASAALRLHVSYVKTCLLDAAARSSTTPARFALADVACGRGQDMLKLGHAMRNSGKVCRALYCSDISTGALGEAERMAEDTLRPRGVPCVCMEADATAPDADLVPPTEGADVVVCHLALHYWCDSADRVLRFFHNAARACAGPHALLVTSFADGRWVVRHGRNRLSQEHGHGCVAPETVAFTVGPFSVAIAAAHLETDGGKSATPFGAAYQFSLGSDRLHGSAEFLVHEGCVEALARKAGWLPVYSKRFDEAAAGFACGVPNPHFAAIAAKMGADPAGLGEDDVRALSLFRAKVYARGEGVGRAFLNALHTCVPAAGSVVLG